MMTRKMLENWAVWIVLDIVYVPTFISRDLPLMAGLYAVFLGLAVLGFIEWRRALAAQGTGPPPGLPPRTDSAYSSVRGELE
jgi:nicotinamide mononucleotide transporter